MDRLERWCSLGWKAALVLVLAVAWTARAMVPDRFLQRLAGQAAQAVLDEAGSAVLREVWSVVAERFYDPALHGVDPADVIAQYSGAAEQAKSVEELRAVINDSLSTLGASHTRWFTPDEQAYYEVLDIFNPDGLDPRRNPEASSRPAGPVTYVGIGCVTAPIDGRRFVTDVYPGGPADRAGLLVGDEIVSVDAQPWADLVSFEGRLRQDVPVTVRRTPGMRALTFTVRPERIQPRQMFLRSIHRSARVEQVDGATLAYVRIRSYAHPDYQAALEELMHDQFADADGLVLDLRGGWGGARAEYTSAFNPALPHMQMRGRGADWADVSRAWDRPLVLLVDQGTRSGKEIVADALQRAGVATVVGTRTAGAVLGGSIFMLGDDSMLMVAVSDVRVDGRSLEGVGVEPDVIVERPIPYCNGADPQVDRALEVLADMVRSAQPL